jgi:glycerophosphoryl diester phosphodiesterase
LRFPFNSTLAIAHRGAHGKGRPENSLAAVEHAIEVGAPAVEFDVCNLRDGRMVISHDCEIRIDGELVALAEITPDELSEKLPGLPPAEPFLEVVADSGLFLNFDWKGNGREERVCELLRSYGLLDRTVVSVEDPGSLMRLKSCDPAVVAGISVEVLAGRDAGDLVRRNQADALMLEYHCASDEVVQAVRQRGAGLFLWTAQDVATFESLLRFEPDGIVTDVIEKQVSGAPVDWRSS